MCTRTLSICISTSRAMLGIIPSGRAPRPRRPVPAPTTRSSSPTASPNTNPPMWAKNATPPCAVSAPNAAKPLTSWSTNQKPEDDDRRHLEQLVEEAEEHERQDPGAGEQDDVRAQRRGDRARGADERDRRVRVDHDLRERRRDPADEVEQQERDRAEAVLDVVAEDPQEQHVAEQVQPAAVQEHAREHPDVAWPEVGAGLERVGDVGRNGAPLPEERLEGRVAAGGGDRQLDREGHEAGADEGQGDERRPARRVPIPERDHWSASGERWPSGLGSGRCRRAASRTAGPTRWRPFSLIQTIASGSSSMPGLDVEAAHVRPARRAVRQPVLARGTRRSPSTGRRAGRSSASKP